MKSLAEMQQLEIELRLVQDQLAQYAESDPQKVEAMSEHASSHVLCMAVNSSKRHRHPYLLYVTYMTDSTNCTVMLLQRMVLMWQKALQIDG